MSVATVELVFGTKPALLQAAISFSIRGDADPIPMLQGGWALTAAEARSVSEFLAIVGRVLVDSAQRSAGLVAAALEAAAQDESLRALSDQLRTQRNETAAWIVDGVLARTPLRPEIDREQAIDTVWLLMDPRVFCAATQDRGWSPERFAQRFSDGVARLLLTTESTTDATPRGPRGSRLSAATHPTTHKTRRS